MADEPPSDERRRRRLRLPRLSSPLRRRNTPTGLASARRVRSDRSTDAPDESWSSSLGVAEASWHASTPSEPISQRRVVRAPSSPASYTMMGSSPPASPPSASPPASPSASPHASRRAFGRRRVARQAQEPVSAGEAARVPATPAMHDERASSPTLGRTPPRQPTPPAQLTVPEPDRGMSSSSSVQTELSHTAASQEEEDVFDDAVSMIQSVRASWAPQVDERERASAEHRHRERLVAYQKRQSMRIEAERELLERHLRLGHEDARREAARKAELLAAEMAREQQELMRLLEHEVQRAQQRRAEQQACEAQALRDAQAQAEAEERRRHDEARRRDEDERQRREARDRRAQQEHARIEEQLRRQRQEAARRADEAARQERRAREEAARRAREEQEALRASMRNKSMDEILQARVTAYEACLGTHPTRSPIEERARQRAQREADDEDRAARVHARRHEARRQDDDDDDASVAETERSAVSRASDASQLTAVMSQLHIVSRQQPPAVKGILSRHSAALTAQPALRFHETRAPSSELRGVPHPDLAWLTYLIQHRLPQPLEHAPARTPRQALGAWIRQSMASVATFETAEPSAGFAALGTARADAPQAVASFLALWEHAPVVHRILASLDLRDVRVLYDVARPLRYMIARPDVHERLLCRFLGPAGYVPWPDLDDPLPLTLLDCEAFHMYMYTEMELPVASHAYLTDMHRLDRRLPRLARSTARAYSRVLARIRLQPQGVPDVPASWTIRGPDGTLHDVGMSSPFVPGYVSTFRAWVPCTDDDDDDDAWGAEIRRMERELFLAGMWRFLQRGDVVVNATNAHRFLFHGDAFAPLDTRFDAAGHLPPFINALLFPTTYYDWILPPTDTPTLFLDVLPWRADIVSSLHLTRDHVEVVRPHGPVYRVAKWLYRAAFTINVPPESIAASGFIESAHDAHASWNGRIVLETEGTTEHVCELLWRLVSPADAPDLLSLLLDSVVQGTNHALDLPPPPPADTLPTYPWRLDRRRSQPGCHWITPVA